MFRIATLALTTLACSYLLLAQEHKDSDSLKTAQRYDVTVVSIKNILGDNLKDSFVATFCTNCLMITDSELNSFFTSPFYLGDLANTEGQSLILLEQNDGKLSLCHKDEMTCVPIDTINRHGKSNLPARFG